jgi:hypothetical protein
MSAFHLRIFFSKFFKKKYSRSWPWYGKRLEENFHKKQRDTAGLREERQKQIKMAPPRGFPLGRGCLRSSDMECSGESGLDQAEMGGFLRGRPPATQFILFQRVFNADAVQEEVSNDCPFPGPAGLAMGHTVLVVVEKGREV